MHEYGKGNSASMLLRVGLKPNNAIRTLAPIQAWRVILDMATSGFNPTYKGMHRVDTAINGCIQAAAILAADHR